MKKQSAEFQIPRTTTMQHLKRKEGCHRYQQGFSFPKKK
jgi:hypothetical protein